MNNSFIAAQQRFRSGALDSLINEYYQLVTKHYAHWAHGAAPCTWYSLDIENSLIDSNKLVAGSYEMVGDLSGWRWRKIVNFDVDDVEALNTTPTIDEKGVTNAEKITTCWLSGGNYIQPHVHDFVLLLDPVSTQSDNYLLRNPPLFEVVNVESSPDFDTRFYKCTLKISYITKDMLEKQVDGLFHFMDYENKIYGIDNGLCLETLYSQRSKLQCDELYNNNTGLYMDVVDLKNVKS